MSVTPDLVKVDVGEGGLPPHGSDEFARYVQTLRLPDGVNVLSHAVVNVPAGDIELVREVAPANSNQGDLRISLALNLLMNRICENCEKKPHVRGALKLCSACCLAWYCSESCQQAQWQTHQLRCCKPDGPLDKGAQKLVFCKME